MAKHSTIKKPAWSLSGTLEWTRKKDGEHNDRPLYSYEAKRGDVNFFITCSTDAGFGLSVYDHKAGKYLTPRHGICWLHTRSRCMEWAEKINKRIIAGLPALEN